MGSEVLTASAFRPDDPDLEGRVILDWVPFDWTEEAQPVTGHPHDAFKRIDALPSDRHVTVSVGGRTLADSHRAVALYETHLPVRCYFPRDDVAMDLLGPSTSTSVCAYKGEATYSSLADAGAQGVDIAWTYTAPLLDASPVRDLVCSTPSGRTSPWTGWRSRGRGRFGLRRRVSGLRWVAGQARRLRPPGRQRRGPGARDHSESHATARLGLAHAGPVLHAPVRRHGTPDRPLG